LQSLWDQFKSLDSLYTHKSTSCKAEPEKEADDVENLNEDGLIEDEFVAVNPDELSISSVKVPEALGSPNYNYDVKNLEEDMAKVDNDWYCLICGKFWHAKGKCKRHMQTHFPRKLACRFCGKMMRSKYKLLKHVNSFHMESVCNSVEENKFESHLKVDGQAKLISDEEGDQAKHDDDEDGRDEHDDEGDGQVKLINGAVGVQAKHHDTDDQAVAKLLNVEEDGQAQQTIDESINNRGAAVTVENKV
jgi:hypothetical protein